MSYNYSLDFISTLLKIQERLSIKRGLLVRAFCLFSFIFSLLLSSIMLDAQTIASKGIPSKLHTDSISLKKCGFSEKMSGYNWGLYEQNSPLLFFSQPENKTLLSFGTFIRRDKGETFVSERGSKDTEGNFHVHSGYHKKNGYSWGSASYSFRKTAEVRFNESNDFDLVAPYVMGDTARAIPLQQHFYTFRAGNVQRLSNWLLSVSANYRASFAFRIQDPRPGNLSTLLEGKLGVGYIWDPYALSLTLGMGRYKQNNHVAFLSDVGSSKEYHFTGLGSDYYRFRGGNTNLFYNGKSYSVGIGLTPSNSPRKGFFFHGDWSLFTTNRIIRTLNNLPLTVLHNHDFQGSLGYLDCKNKSQWGAELFTRGRRSLGEVNIFGSSVAGLYPQIYTEHSYYRLELDYGTRFFIRNSSLEPKGFLWGTSLSLMGRMFRETHLPQAQAKRDHFVISLAPFVYYRKGIWDCFAAPYAEVALRLGSPTLSLAKQVDPIEEYQQLLNKNFAIASGTQTRLGISIGASCKLTSSYSLLLSTSYYNRLTSLASQRELSINLGLLF